VPELPRAASGAKHVALTDRWLNAETLWAFRQGILESDRTEGASRNLLDSMTFRAYLTTHLKFSQNFVFPIDLKAKIP
jgi:hypothetical protein